MKIMFSSVLSIPKIDVDLLQSYSDYYAEKISETQKVIEICKNNNGKMFATENKGLRWWLRLPFINLVVYTFLFILGCIEKKV